MDTTSSLLITASVSLSDDSEWQVVGGSKSTKGLGTVAKSKSARNLLAIPTHPQTAHQQAVAAAQQHESHQKGKDGRRKSQPTAVDRAASLHTPSNNNKEADTFKSFRKGAGSARTQNISDWRRAGSTGTSVTGSGLNSLEPPSPVDHEVKPATHSPTKQNSNPNKIKKSPKNLSRPVSRGKSPSGASTPTQTANAHQVIHQIGHSRFALGPVDFPNLLFRRVMWKAEKDKLMSGNSSPESASPPPEVAAIEETITSVATEVAAAVEAVEEEIASINQEVPAEEEVPAVVVIESAVVVQEPLPAVVVAEPILDVEIVPAADSVDEPTETVVVAPKAKKPKKKKVATPVAPAEEVEAEEVVEEAPKVVRIEPTTVESAAEEKEDAEVEEETTPSPLTPVSPSANHRVLVIQILIGLIGFLVVLSFTFPSIRITTLPIVILLITGLVALHHPSNQIQSKLPNSLRLLDGTIPNRSGKSDFNRSGKSGSPAHSKKKHNKKGRK